MPLLSDKCLSSSKAFYFSESVGFEKVYVVFLINETFKIVGSVLKGAFHKVFHKIFFRD